MAAKSAPSRSWLRAYLRRYPARRRFLVLIVRKLSNIGAITAHHVDVAAGLCISDVQCRFVLEAGAIARESNPFTIGRPRQMSVVAW